MNYIYQINLRISHWNMQLVFLASIVAGTKYKIKLFQLRIVFPEENLFLYKFCSKVLYIKTLARFTNIFLNINRVGHLKKIALVIATYNFESKLLLNKLMLSIDCLDKLAWVTIDSHLCELLDKICNFGNWMNEQVVFFSKRIIVFERPIAIMQF